MIPSEIRGVIAWRECRETYLMPVLERTSSFRWGSNVSSAKSLVCVRTVLYYFYTDGIQTNDFTFLVLYDNNILIGDILAFD